MEKSLFNKMMKEEFLKYGFKKEGNHFILLLPEISIDVRYTSSLGVKYFGYSFAINDLHDPSVPYTKRYNNVLVLQMQNPRPIYHRPTQEFPYEIYDEDECRELLRIMIHNTFDPLKNDGLEYIKAHSRDIFMLTKDAKIYLGLA